MNAVLFLYLFHQAFLSLSGVDPVYSYENVIKIEVSNSSNNAVEYSISMEVFISRPFSEFSGTEGWSEFITSVEYPKKKVIKKHTVGALVKKGHEIAIAEVIDPILWANADSFRVVINTLDRKTNRKKVLAFSEFKVRR